jgi:hypothetical protein
MKLKTTLATSIALGLMTAAGTAVAAQTDESPSGTYFSGVVSFEDSEWGGVAAHGILEDVLCGPNDEPAGIIVDDISIGSIIEATDPRISGVLDEAYSQLNCFVDEETVASAYWVEYRITNDEGSWSGGGPGYIARELEWEDPRSLAYWHTMTGDGAYDGLTAVFLRQRNAWNEDGPPTHVVNGIIIAGDLPPASDFEGSRDLVETIVPDPRFPVEGDEGEAMASELDDFSSPLQAAVDEAAAALGPDVGGEVALMATVADVMSDESRLAKAESDLGPLGLTPDDVEIYWFPMGREDEASLQGSAFRFPGVDATLLREVMHPDNGNFLSNPAGAPNPAEELSWGGQTVYAIWDQGVPLYWYTGDEMIIHLVGPEGPTTVPEEAAVDAFFTALLGPAD